MFDPATCTLNGSLKRGFSGTTNCNYRSSKGYPAAIKTPTIVDNYGCPYYFFNEISALCEVVNADVHAVAKGMGLDGRIGRKFLHPGPGYGGSCFPKDTRALVRIAQENNVTIRIVKAVMEVNEAQKARMIDKIRTALGGSENGKTWPYWAWLSNRKPMICGTLRRCLSCPSWRKTAPGYTHTIPRPCSRQKRFCRNPSCILMRYT